MPTKQSTSRNADERLALWQSICTDRQKDLGANVRFHYRPLPPGFWATLAWRYGYHTWMELLDSEGEPLATNQPLVWGVYEGRHQSGPEKGEHNTIAEAKWMIWEYEEDGGLARWGSVGHRGHGFMDIHLPQLSFADFDQVMCMVDEGLVIELGLYGYLLPWLGPILDVWNCQRYVRVYCRQRGGPKGLFHKLGRMYWAGREGKISQERNHGEA